MLKKAFLAGALLCCSGNLLLADFTYEQSMNITGGAMAAMMKMASAFSKQLRMPMRTTVMVKGDRMVHASEGRLQIIDLNKETMTDVDLQKRTYSVITFAELTKALSKVTEKMTQKNSEGEMKFKIDVRDTANTKNIGGFNAKEKLLLVDMEATDKKGQKGGMSILTNMWLTPAMPGYNEVRDFQMKMGQKLAWTPGGGMLSGMAGAQPGMAQGMSEMYKQASKLDGMPIQQVMRIMPRGDAPAHMPSDAELRQMNDAAAKAQTEQQAQQQGNASAAAGSAAAGAAGSRLGRIGGLAGMAGGLGGFGKKKTEQPAPNDPQTSRAATPGAETLMEMTVEMSGFSTSPADASKFEVPAGFKQVDNDMNKLANK